MSERNDFDLTRGAEVVEDKALVLSLRRRGRPTLPPGTPSQSAPHRHLASRVQVPLTEPAQPASEQPATLGWNEPPDIAGRPPQPTPQPDPQTQDQHPAPRRRAAFRPTHMAALGTALLVAAVALVGSELPSGDARAPRTQAASANTDYAALLSARPLILAGQTLATDIDKLGSGAKQDDERARKHHAAARHAPRSPAVAATKGTTARSSQSTYTQTERTPTVSYHAPAPVVSSPQTSSGAKSGSTSSSGVKKGPPPCYPGTLGCQ